MFGRRAEAESLASIPSLDFGQPEKPDLSLPARVAFQFFNEFAYGRGRTHRPEYLVYVAVLVVLFTPALLIDRANGNLVITTILASALAIPTMAFTTRRLHDVGRRGWLMWVPVLQTLFVAKAVNLGLPGYLTARLGWSQNIAALHQPLKDERLAWVLSGIFMGLSAIVSFIMIGALLFSPGNPDENSWGKPDD